jgi:hypothetical protein
VAILPSTHQVAQAKLCRHRDARGSSSSLAAVPFPLEIEIVSHYTLECCKHCQLACSPTAASLQASPGKQPRGEARKAEPRKLARAARQAEWEAFLATKPDDSYLNPEDVAAIQHARMHMGDFKLKTDPNYMPSDEERMTAPRKKQQVQCL